MERLAEGQLVNQLYVPSSICHTLQYQEIFCFLLLRRKTLISKDSTTYSSKCIFYEKIQHACF